MTINYVTKNEVVTRTVTETVKKNIGVIYTSDSSDRAIRVTPSSSFPGRYTVTISNPNSSNELAITLKPHDLADFLDAAATLVNV